jgi:hypothetical protein
MLTVSRFERAFFVGQNWSSSAQVVMMLPVASSQQSLCHMGLVNETTPWEQSLCQM